MTTQQALIKKYIGKKIPFKALPKEWQLALIHYMVIDGDGWESPEDEIKFRGEDGSPAHQKAIVAWMNKHRKYFIKNYGTTKFGMLNIPTAEFCDLVFKFQKKHDPDMDFGSFKEYHEWYLSECLGSKGHLDYVGEWPAILGDDIGGDFEILQDGWHRFHSYVKMGRKTIPIVYYV